MNTDQALSTLRLVLGWVGLVLILCAAAKFAGFNVPLKGDYWQVALMGMALKAA